MNDAALPYQAATYEALAFLGPVWSAVCSGFAVILFGTTHLTPSGERYLEVYHPQQKD